VRREGNGTYRSKDFQSRKSLFAEMVRKAAIAVAFRWAIVWAMLNDVVSFKCVLLNFISYKSSKSSKISLLLMLLYVKSSQAVKAKDRCDCSSHAKPRIRRELGNKLTYSISFKCKVFSGCPVIFIHIVSATNCLPLLLCLCERHSTALVSVSSACFKSQSLLLSLSKRITFILDRGFQY